ncbi:MAG: acyl-CoA carboxylase subunit beta [Bacteroidetes bacterium]|nr:MAG: acyl-CoA carboxylase subunit beta [Bacteroidota bacterium]
MNIEQNRNEDINKQLSFLLQSRLNKIYEGGGIKRQEKEREKGKMTARERIAYLLDEGAPQLEIGALVGYEMYEEEGGCPSGGVIVVLGYVQGRQCLVVANDATVKSGAWFPITGKKNLRAQEIAMENKLPVVYLVDSAGIFLPLQADIFADKEHFGRMFRNNAQMSAMGIPQISVIMGSCVAGGAYLPIMSDEAMIVEGTGSIFLAGPFLVKASIGEDVDAETLGGATTQCEISGVTDNKYPDDQSALQAVKKIFGKMGDRPKAGFNRIQPKLPALDMNEIYRILPEDRVKPYDMLEILKRMVDDSELDLYKEGYGKSIICARARIDGWAVGIVANQRIMVKSKKGEMQMGGVIYSDSADKAARFIMVCNQEQIPLIFLHDVTGFMVGSRSEHGGIIKDGAKMVSAMANSVVPKFTFVLGNSYGAGNYAMCGRAYDPRFMYAWTSGRIAVMSGKAAANTLLQIQVASMKAKGQTISPEDQTKLLEEITQRYENQTSPYYAAARLWIDGIIDPLETRRVISMGIEAANHAPIEKRYNVGVIQT